MPNDLAKQIHALAEVFARGVAAAVRASVAESRVDAEPSRAQPGPGRPRRSAPPPLPVAPSAATNAPARLGRGRPKRPDTEASIAMIVDYVTKHPGSDGETTRRAINMDKHRWSGVLRYAISAGKLRTWGAGRGRRYWAV
jgi:hypothetical protein